LSLVAPMARSVHGRVSLRDPEPHIVENEGDLRPGPIYNAVSPGPGYLVSSSNRLASETPRALAIRVRLMTVGLRSPRSMPPR